VNCFFLNGYKESSVDQDNEDIDLPLDRDVADTTLYISGNGQREPILRERW
jgi:hypothetical protein